MHKCIHNVEPFPQINDGTFRGVPTIVESLCKIFECRPLKLHEILNNPISMRKAVEFLRGKTLRTLHLKDGNRLLKFGDISPHGANRLLAYEGFCDRLTVKQHFYARHRIRLHYPTLPCIIIYNANGPGHSSYYPMEVVTVANDDSAQPESAH